jgi:hypothetical protein
VQRETPSYVYKLTKIVRWRKVRDIPDVVDAIVVERVGRMTDEDQYLNTMFMF